MLSIYVHDLDPVALPLFGKLSLKWYGLAYLMGFLAGFVLLRHLARRRLWVLEPGKTADFIAAAAMFGVFLGGRLGYVLMYMIPEKGLGAVLADPLIIFKVWEGGMASHGGILGLVIFTWFYAKKHKVTWTGLGDGLCVVAPLGLFFGRVANFINGELYGRVAHGVGWAVKFPLSLYEQPANVRDVAFAACRRIDPRLENVGSVEQLVAVSRGNPQVLETLAAYIEPRYPSQLIEAGLEGLLLFAILWTVRVTFRKAPDGLLTGLFFLLYAVFRIIGEQFREPDSAMIGPLTKGQFFSLFMFLFAAGFFFHAWRGWRKRERNVAGIP
ncbi:MAG: prolipoprotein diacylglyceryl transferase [Verrucomicrobiota bacterium]